ncbi:UvrD-helicase domain-containing protein, partial [Kribbia dieselivorans]|uniref:UvrD-helicase domain-containing protein n=1 Tax=Kribbia dieselivorans TaxID=331526 RepID=UPI000838ECE0
MAHIVLGPQQHAPDVDSAVRAKAYNFLAKLQKDDTVPGLHIEPIKRAVDSRVRTGRVDHFWRAVMFRVVGDEPVYVYLGVWPHDDAITFAQRARLAVNPVNGIAELLIADASAQASDSEPARPEPVELPAAPNLTQQSAPEPPSQAEAPVSVPSEPILTSLGLTEQDLAGLGLNDELVELALEATGEDEIAAIADAAVTWQGVALLDLASGRTVADVKATLDIEQSSKSEPAPEGVQTSDDELRQALSHPAARLQFAFIEDNEELRRAIEDGDFAAWRVFLHPEQRRYAEGSWGGPFRLSGGAGTGKTVVLLHRARHLAHLNPSARIMLTTFNKTLADGLLRDLKTLDPALPIAETLGAPGIYVRGVDAAARAVIQANSGAVARVLPKVLGSRTAEVGAITHRHAWRDAVASAGTDLSVDLANPTFFQAEYSSVILPQRVTTLEEYVKVRRPGRGVPLDRTRRRAVWAVVESYRLSAGIAGSVDFPESAALAAELLDLTGDRPFDHVLVDEGQDLAPTQWQFLRAMVAEGADDLFIAEDSHQRIYGRKVVLGRLGIRIVGRSQRLRLNYRTTAQNLRYAVSVLAGTEYVDLEEEAEDTSDYR